MVFLLNDKNIFPDPALADEDGLLAVGGDLSTDRLVLAYQSGIFPWYSEGEPILWYSPHQRFVILPHEIKISQSMRQLMRSNKYRITCNGAFTEVIRHCAKTKRPGQRGTWITTGMQKAYIDLHKKGVVHSIEIWAAEKLIGGLYGLAIGRVFCGESMFSLHPNASKLALVALCQSAKYDLIDCQLHTSHLESMGAKMMERSVYMAFLNS